MFSKNIDVANVISIHFLDIMDNHLELDDIKCRLILLNCNNHCILIEPILDYIDRDIELNGMSIIDVDGKIDEKLKEDMILRQKSLGYQSSLWIWDDLFVEENELIRIFFGKNRNADSSAAIYCDKGNLLFKKKRL